MVKNNISSDDAFEAFLQLALVEIANEENNELIKDFESHKVTLPEKYSKKMNRYIKTIQIKRTALITYTFLYKTALIFLAIFGLCFTILLFNENVRASCQDFIIEIYQKYIIINNNKDLSADKPSQPDTLFLSEGYMLTDSLITEKTEYYCYENGTDSIEIYRFNIKNSITFDNEHYNIYSFVIEDTEYLYCESIDNNFSNILYWHSNDWYYELHSSLDKNNIIKFVEKMKNL